MAPGCWPSGRAVPCSVWTDDAHLVARVGTTAIYGQGRAYDTINMFLRPTDVLWPSVVPPWSLLMIMLV